MIKLVDSTHAGGAEKEDLPILSLIYFNLIPHAKCAAILTGIKVGEKKN
jgi:hypothetical protein